jgi:hypothetical protein
MNNMLTIRLAERAASVLTAKPRYGCENASYEVLGARNRVLGGVVKAAFDDLKHPHVPSGSREGGRFSRKLFKTDQLTREKASKISTKQVKFTKPTPSAVVGKVSAPPAKVVESQLPIKALFVRIYDKTFPIASYEEASIKFEEGRDFVFKNGGNSDDIPRVDIVDSSGNQIGYVSQNGRVWEGIRQNWQQNKVVYEPRREKKSEFIIESSSLAYRAANIICASHSDSVTDKHDRIRRQAEKRYQQAVDDFAAHAKAEAIAAKRRTRDEMIALFLLLMLDAAYEGYLGTYAGLAKLEPSKEAFAKAELEAEAEQFAEARQEFLAEFPVTMIERFDAVLDGAAGASEREIRALLNKAAQAVKVGSGRVVAETEAQVTYGNSQLRVLKRAGFTHKAWNTEDDELVRESHAMCEEQGSIPIDAIFHNGLVCPGDKNGNPEDVINCRCWLTGQGRK